jgi:hypothetical protein
MKFALIQSNSWVKLFVKAALEHLNLALRMCPNSLGPDSSFTLTSTFEFVFHFARTNI